MAGSRPDVRVRLSAEGVNEVVNALKKIATDAEKAGRKGSRGFKGLNNVLTNTKNMLGGLLGVLSVRQLTRWISGAVDMADTVAKLGTKVGATTEHLSALALVARTADTDITKVGIALAKMNKYLGDARKGNPQAIATFRDLGIELDDLAGMDAVEIFDLLAKRITAMPTQIERSTTATAIFGKSGANLLRTMEDLAREGFGAVIERARELGVLIDTDLAQAAEGIKDDFELLKAQGEGLGLRLAAGLVPEVSQALQTISGDLKQTVSVWESTGAGIGKTIKWITAIVSTAFDSMGTQIGLFVVATDARMRAFVEILKLNFDEAEKITQEAAAYILEEQRKLGERIAARFVIAARVEPPRVSGGAADGRDGEAGATPAELAARKAQALQTGLDRELALIRTASSLRLAEEKRAFNEGLQGVEEYYAERRAIIDASYKAEMDALKQKRVLLDEEVDPARRLQEEKKIETEEAKAQLVYEGKIGALISEELQNVRALGRERLQIQKAILAAQGRAHEIAIISLEQQIEKADLLYRKQGLSDADREAALARLRQALESVAEFEEVKRQANAAMGELALAREEIRAQMAAGVVGQLQGEAALLEIETERLGTLRAIAEAMLAAAEATGDPKKIAQAQKYAAGIRAIGYAVEASSDAFTQFKDTALAAGEDALADFLETGLEGTKNLGEAFQAMAATVIQAIRRMAAEMLASQIFQFVGGLFGGGGEVKTQTQASVARGGWIRGAGTGTSDSIMARLSDEEYVIRSAVTRQPGVRRHLDSLNRQGGRALVGIHTTKDLPRFASGGLVDLSSIERQEGTGGELNGTLELGLEKGLVVNAMKTREGQRLIIKTITDHRHEVRAGLGGL